MISKTVWGYVNDYSQRLSDCHSQFFLKLSCEVFSFGNLNIEVEKFIKILRFLLFIIDMAWQIFAFIHDEVSQAIIEIWIFCYDGVKTAANCSEAARRW